MGKITRFFDLWENLDSPLIGFIIAKESGSFFNYFISKF